jgi:sulfatase-like protein
MAGVHLAVLWSFAFAQPLLDLLGDTPEFFVARGNTRGDILLLAFALVFVPPLLLTLLEGLVALFSERLRGWLHLALVAVLTAAFALQLIKDVSVRSAVLLAAALAIGGLGAAAYARTAAGPALLSVLSPAPLVFLFIFLIVSPVSNLVMPGDEARAAGVNVPGRPPVVVILWDEFAGFTLDGADGHIDAARYPNFARFARDATWYRNATTVADYTERAVPALLTGDRPDKAALPIASDHPESLFTLLGGTYSLDVTEPVTDICPERLCPEENASRDAQPRRMRDLASDLSLVTAHLLLPRPLRNELAPVDRSFGDFRAEEAAPQAQPVASGAASRGFAALAAVIDRMKIFNAFEQRLGRTPKQGSLVFFHMQMPHNPYHYLPSGQRYPETVERMPGLETDQQPAAGRWRADSGLTRQGLERYLLQIGDTDRLLGRLLDRMRVSGLYNRALIVVLADHGASFLPGHPHRAADAIDLPSIAGIPLLIKSPHQHRGRIDESNVHITDVLPTIADRLGVKLPWPTDGRPAGLAPKDGAIRLQPQYGDADLTMPFTEYLRRRDKLVQRMLEDFGTGPGALYRGGPDGDLIGRTVSSAVALSSASFELDGGGLLADVDPGGAIVPSFLTGELSGVPPGERVAVAVDGRVAATAVRWRDGDTERFSAIVPPNEFAAGANSVDLIAISGSGDTRRLARLPGAPLGYRLTQRGGRQVIVDAPGRAIPVADSGTGGSVDSVNVGQTEVRIVGRVGEGDRVLAFAGARFLGAGRPAADGGFELSGWAAGPRPGSDAAPVRVFATVGGRALPIPEPKRP